MTEPTTTEPRKQHRPQRRRVPASQRPSLRLTERDRAILKAVWTNRFLTRSLLTELFPPESGAATSDHTHLARRLQALYQHGYLDRLRAHPTAEVVYALGPHGAKQLLTRSVPVEDTDWQEKNRRIKELYIEHALMVARLRVALTLAVQQKPSLTLERFQRESATLKAEWQHRGRRLYVNPDGFFILRDTARPEGKQRSAFFVEADRSTMTLARLRAKFGSYAALYADREHQHAFGIPSFRVLTVTKSPERASNLLKLLLGEAVLADLDHRALFLFTTEETYRHHLPNILAAVWRSADTPHDFRSLISSPLPRL